MKKSIIALAAVAAMAAQADNTTLYGRVSMAYTYNDNGDMASTSGFGDNGSRFGIKGSTDLGNGMSSFYKYENRVGGGTATTKLLYVGLQGGFGSVSFGKQWLPTDGIDVYDDPFNALTPEGGAGFKGKTLSNNAMIYKTPNMNGFQAAAAVIANGAHAVDASGGATHGNTVDGAHVDYINTAVTYDANGFKAGLGYETSNGLTKNNGKDDADVDVITLGVGYGNEMFEVGMLAERYEMNDDDVYNARLSGLYNITPSDAVYLGFANEFKDIDGADDGWAAAIGYQHKFSDRTRVWTEYSFQDDGDLIGDQNTLSIGLRTDF